MFDSNITEYKNEPGEFHYCYGKITLKKGLYFGSYEESFYHLVGQRILLGFPDLLHPEDLEPFRDAVRKLDEGDQQLILRLLCGDGEETRYRFFYIYMTRSTKVLEGERLIEIDLTEIMAITDRYKLYIGLINKYREFMSLFTNIFMEYDYSNDSLKLYQYDNRRYTPLFYESLEEHRWKVEKNKELNVSQKAEFEVFYNMLKNGKDNISVGMDAACLFEAEMGTETRYEIRLGIIFENNRRTKSLGVVESTGKKQEKEKYYLSASAYDPGTGVLNKRAINEYAVDMIQKKTQGLCVAIVDLDDFKKINDSYGHMMGDEVLSRVAEIMKSSVDNKGVVGRFGGDEFMVILEGMNEEIDLRRELSTLSSQVRMEYSDPEGPRVTLSIGASRYPVHGETYEELFQKADKCVYIAKAKGKNRFIMYDEKKHGDVVVEDGKRINVGLKVVYGDDKKNDLVSDLAVQLYREGVEAFIPVMEQMQQYFDIDGIAVYAGENLERKLSVGKYINPLENLSFAKNKEYQALFNEQGFYAESQVAHLKTVDLEAYENYVRQENGKVFQCEVLRDGVPACVVSFDFFNRQVKHGVTDTGLMKIVARIMAEVYSAHIQGESTK